MLVTMNRQNRFARRVGLPMLTFALQLLFASALITGFLALALRLADDGVLTVPDDIARKMHNEGG